MAPVVVAAVVAAVLLARRLQAGAAVLPQFRVQQPQLLARVLKEAQLLPRQQPVPLEVAVPLLQEAEVAAAVVLVQGLVASEILRRR